MSDIVVNPDATTVAPTESKSVPAKAETSVPSKASEDFTAKVARASNPREVQELLRQMKESPAPTPEAKAPDAPVETPAEETPPVGEVKPAAEEKAPAPVEEKAPEEKAEPDDANVDEVPEGDEDLEVSPLMGKRTHIRLPPDDDKVGRLALALIKRNKDLKLADAVIQAKAKLGIEEPKAAVETPKETPAEEPTNGLPKTVSEVDAKLKELRSQRKALTTDLKFDEAAELSDQIEDLLAHKGTLERKSEREAAEQEATARAEYERGFVASEKRASELYDFAADPNSEGGKRMKEIDDFYRDNNDPLYNSPNKPLVIAQMVARELRIAPKIPNAKKAAPAKAAPPPATPKPKSVLPEGGAATTAPTTAPQGKLAESLQKITTLADLRKAQAAVGLPH
jgi:hypothetical protein